MNKIIKRQEILSSREEFKGSRKFGFAAFNPKTKQMSNNRHSQHYVMMTLFEPSLLQTFLGPCHLGGR